MYLIAIILPLVSFLVNSLIGRKIGQQGSIIVSNIIMVISAIIAYIGVYEIVIGESKIKINLGRWIMSIDWTLQFDNLTILMCVIILSISTSVFIYTSIYMSADPHGQRFYGYLSLFIFFMLVVVTSNNYLVLFLGWEGIGISSYLLINFWYNRVSSNQASFQAIIMNRIGDWGVIVFIISILRINPTLEIGIEINNWLPNSSIIFTIISVFLIIGAMGKSAQLGLHNWLPLSMEGPTPVSALLHAATLVTAGVYIIVRSINYLTDVSYLIIILISSSTALFAALTGILVYDIKKVIAYSTCSQLGYMFLAIGLKQESMGIFHLLNHAYFKALLFLSAGAIIHALNDEQDIRRMGGLISYLPWTYTMNLIGSLSLLAIPYLSGYYSKEIILDYAFQNTIFCITLDTTLDITTDQLKDQLKDQIILNLLITKTWAYWVGTFTVILTTIYTINTIIRIFMGIPRITSIKVINLVKETPIRMSIPLVFLSINSIVIGYILKDLNSSQLITTIIKNMDYDYEMIKSTIIVYIPTIVSLIMIIIISMTSMSSTTTKDPSGNINNNIIITGLLMISMILIKNIDQGIINPGKIVQSCCFNKNRKGFYTGIIQIYIYQIIVSIIIILII